MAEFCLACWNKINDDQLTEQDVILSDEMDFCEGCGAMKQVIVCLRENRKFSLIDFICNILHKK